MTSSGDRELPLTRAFPCEGQATRLWTARAAPLNLYHSELPQLAQWTDQIPIQVELELLLGPADLLEPRLQGFLWTSHPLCHRPKEEKPDPTADSCSRTCIHPIFSACS